MFYLMSFSLFLFSSFFFLCRGDFENAIVDYTKSLELNPSNAAAYNNRGFAYRKLGRYDEAIADYTVSLELAPENIKTLNNRGYSCVDFPLFFSTFFLISSLHEPLPFFFFVI